MRPDFASAYDEHVWQVYGFFAYRVRSRTEAEDLTQAAFERALRAWGRYDPERAPVLTWLLSIARNLLIDHYRADRSDRERPLDLGESEPAGEETYSGLGLSPELERALAGLGEREREIIGLRFGADLSGAQIASITGLSLANVQQILSRSLRRLRIEIEAAQEASSTATSRATPPDA